MAFAERVSYDLGGFTGGLVYEDVADAIQNIDPTDTPAYSSFGRETMSARMKEWIVGVLAATSTTTRAEGDAFATAASPSRWRYNNRSAIFWDGVQISDTVRALDIIGANDEYLLQVDNAMTNQKRNWEASIFANSTAGATGADGTASTFTPLRGFVSSNASVPSSPASAPTIIVTAENGTIELATIINAHKSMFTKGARPDSLWLSPGVKNDFVTAVYASGNSVRYNINLESATAHQDVEMFRTPYGVLAVIVDLFIPQASASTVSASWFLLERRKLKICDLRKMRVVPMMKDGDRTNAMVISEGTLKVEHPYAVAVGTGVSTPD